MIKSCCERKDGGVVVEHLKMVYIFKVRRIREDQAIQ